MASTMTVTPRPSRAFTEDVHNTLHLERRPAVLQQHLLQRTETALTKPDYKRCTTCNPIVPSDETELAAPLPSKVDEWYGNYIASFQLVS